MNDEPESDDYMDGLFNESPRRISFDYLCRLLDPKQSETPLWYKIIDRTAGIVLFFQIDYESRKPTVSRCVRLTRENFSNLREFLEVAIFLNGRELPPSVVASVLGRSYINSTAELTKVLEEVEVADLSELVEDDEDNTLDESSSRLQSDPAVRKLRAVLGEAPTVQPAVSKDVPNNHGDNSQSAQRKNDRRGLRGPSPTQQVETDQTGIPKLDIPDLALGLPQLSDEEDDRYSDRGRAGAPAHMEKETSITQQSLKPLLFPVKRKQDATTVNAPFELNLGVVQALIPLPVLPAAPVLLDVEETCPEPSRTMSKANNSSETYYWGAPGEDKVALHPGFLIYVYRNVLEDLKDQFGPGKRSHWSKYAHRLAVHLLGGWGKILKNDKCRNGFEAMLGSEFFNALAGHVHQVFSTEITKEELLGRLNKTLKTCLESHTARKPAGPRPKPNPPSAAPIVKLKVVPDKPVHPTTERRNPSPVACKVVYEKPTRSLRSPTKPGFSYDVEQDDAHDSDRDPEYDPDHSGDDGSEKSYEPVKSNVPRSATKTHQTKRVAPPVAIHLDPEVRHSKEASAEPTEKTSTKRKKYYWMNPSEDTVPVRVGYNVHVYRGILEDLQSRYGPGKNPWYTYAQKLIVHLIGGWENYINDTGVIRSPLFDKYLGSAFCLAIIGHVQEFFNVKITKENLLTKLTSSVGTCRQKMKRHQLKRQGAKNQVMELLDVSETIEEAHNDPLAKNHNTGFPVQRYEGESLEKYYWSTPGDDKVPLCPGYNVYVNEKILEEIGKLFGPPKTDWSRYMHRLIKHLLGGWENFLKDKKPGTGLVSLLGDDFFVALAGHLRELFRITVTRNLVVEKLKGSMAQYQRKMRLKEKVAS